MMLSRSATFRFPTVLFLLLFLSLRNVRGQEHFRGMVQIFGNEEGAAHIMSKQWEGFTKDIYTSVSEMFPSGLAPGTNFREYYLVIRKADDIYDCGDGASIRFWFPYLGKAGQEILIGRDWGTPLAGSLRWLRIPDNKEQVQAILQRDGGTFHFSHNYFRLDVKLPATCPGPVMKIYSVYIAAIDKAGGTPSPFNLNTEPAAATLARSSIGGLGGRIVVKDGNVGIGTLAPQSDLAVKGTITAEKVKVTQTGWADFVFDEAYSLRSLAEVETYIQKHRRLPDIPSEKEVQQHGNDLGEMDKRLLQKVEELTLYLIELKKENQQIRKEISELKRNK